MILSIFGEKDDYLLKLWFINKVLRYLKLILNLLNYHLVGIVLSSYEYTYISILIKSRQKSGITSSIVTKFKALS